MSRMTPRYLTASMRMVLLLLMLMQLAVASSEDDVCMVCECGGGSCSGNSGCCYRFDTEHLLELVVQVNCSRPGESIIIPPKDFPSVEHPQDSGRCNGFHIFHENGCLTAFPSNYCAYPDIRAISLAGNNLSVIPDLTCLPKTGKLDLRRNTLTSVSRNAFKGLSSIREIFLDYNEIEYIHPLAFEHNLSELSIFSVSYNRLLTIEAWPMALHHPFCFFDFSHNRVHSTSNRAHWKFNISMDYGPGFVDLSYNRFEYIPNLHKFGIDSFLEMAKFMAWGFDFRHNPLRCDCHIYDLAYWGKKLVKAIWRDYFDVKCGSPPSLRGTLVIEVPLDELVCNITAVDHCPPGCRCEDRPSSHGIFVFCDSAGMETLPVAVPVIPANDDLILHMANNSLRTLPPRKYLSRAKLIDLSDNHLKTIEKSTPHVLRYVNLTDLRGNDLQHLPSTFQVLDPRSLLLDLHTLRCSCDLQWMPTWLRHSHGHHLDGMTCLKQNGQQILLANASKLDFCDKTSVKIQPITKVTLIVAVTVTVVVSLVLLVFRYEALVMMHRCTHGARCKKQRCSELPTNTHFDIFISMSANSDSDWKWVNDVLMPRLDHLGITSFLPSRDCEPGSVEMDEVTKRLKDSAAVLVVLSADYLDSDPCLFQFSQAYNHMVACGYGNLLLFRMDSLVRRWPSVREPHLRAMLRLHMFYSADSEHVDKALKHAYYRPTIGLVNEENRY